MFEPPPPKKKKTVTSVLVITFAYSPIKKRANVVEEYSTLYPDTSSASASGKSKGGRLTSAKVEIKKSKKVIKKGKINHPCKI